ncbi:MAG: hypothetical protein QOJ99_353 [Bryobacterales bacterium]|jgi:hypothetical protein|nr:hypothetical protein [Bryobacterales bacterium]
MPAMQVAPLLRAAEHRVYRLVNRMNVIEFIRNFESVRSARRMIRARNEEVRLMREHVHVHLSILAITPSVQTTERYWGASRGCRQKLRYAVNAKLGLKDSRTFADRPHAVNTGTRYSSG